MNHFLVGNYSECKDELSALLEGCKEDGVCDISTLFLNIGVCDFRLSSYRKCVSQCLQAIQYNPCNLRAYILQGKAYYHMNRLLDAQNTWNQGLAVVQTQGRSDIDFLAMEEMISLLKQKDIPSITDASISNPSSSSKGVEVVSVESSGYTLDSLHLEYVIRNEHMYDKAFLEEVRQKLAHATGSRKVDDLISIGYLQVNTGNLKSAVDIFTRLNGVRAGIPAVYLGLGSALALLGRIDEAITSFSSAIAADPTVADAWKRRGQTRAARDLCSGALSDLTRSLELAPTDADTYLQRGFVFTKIKLFEKSLADFNCALRLGEDSAVVHNCIGMSSLQLGDLFTSSNAYDQAISRDPDFIEVYLNKGRMHKEAGQFAEALAAYNRGLNIDCQSNFPVVYKLRAQLHYGGGLLLECISDLERYNGLVEHDDEAIVLLGLCFQSTGDFTRAVDCFSVVLEAVPQHPCAYLKAVALLMSSHLDTPVSSFHLDSIVDPRIKDGLSRRCSWSALMGDNVDNNGYNHVNRLPRDVMVVESDELRAVTYSRLALTAREVSAVVQLDCTGFLPNTRQRLMFGLASLQCAHTLLEGGGELQWRDLYEEVVRWRQVSEPNDIVFWIDGYPADAFKEGFGLTTPIQNGELKTIRYYSYFNLTLSLVKRLLNEDRQYWSVASERIPLKADQLRRLDGVQSLEDLHILVGRDFYVITRCESQGVNAMESIAEGTRITLLVGKTAGFEFSIRTPGTPSRWTWFDAELSVCLSRLRDSIHDVMTAGNASITAPEDVLKNSLVMFYYFVNFAPLTRGSAVVAYCLLNASLLSVGWCVCSPLPRGIQLDWEAILAPSLQAFVEKARSCVMCGAVSQAVREEVATASAAAGIGTVREMLKILSLSTRRVA